MFRRDMLYAPSRLTERETSSVCQSVRRSATLTQLTHSVDSDPASGARIIGIGFLLCCACREQPTTTSQLA